MNKLQKTYGSQARALGSALEAGDEAAFLTALDELTSTRQGNLRADLRDVTVNLRFALDRFSVNSRLLDLAAKEVPDARHRLQHVLRLTGEAAHTTLDLVEQSVPLLERATTRAADLLPLWRQFQARQISPRDFGVLRDALDAFLVSVRQDAATVRNHLSEVLLAQGYQDLTGQIIGSVMHLVTELEAALAQLSRISDGGAPRADGAGADPGGARPAGPTVPGIATARSVTGQQDVDDVLASLGM